MENEDEIPEVEAEAEAEVEVEVEAGVEVVALEVMVLFTDTAVDVFWAEVIIVEIVLVVATTEDVVAQPVPVDLYKCINICHLNQATG